MVDSPELGSIRATATPFWLLSLSKFLYATFTKSTVLRRQCDRTWKACLSEFKLLMWIGRQVDGGKYHRRLASSATTELGRRWMTFAAAIYPIAILISRNWALELCECGNYSSNVNYGSKLVEPVKQSCKLGRWCNILPKTKTSTWAAQLEPNQMNVLFFSKKENWQRRVQDRRGNNREMREFCGCVDKIWKAPRAVTQTEYVINRVRSGSSLFTSGFVQSRRFFLFDWTF